MDRMIGGQGIGAVVGGKGQLVEPTSDRVRVTARVFDFDNFGGQ